MSHSTHQKITAASLLVALGIIYGDIGTSRVGASHAPLRYGEHHMGMVHYRATEQYSISSTFFPGVVE